MTELSAAAAGIVYVLGFVVANVHYARYESVRFDFVRGRYVGAGLLFAISALVPAFAGWIIGGEFRRSDTKPKKARQLTAASVFVISTPMFTLVLYGLLRATATAAFSKTGMLIFTLVVEAVFATVGSLAVKLQRSRAPFSFRSVAGWRPIIVAYAVLAVAGLFGRLIYPSVSPAFGGGAGSLARIYVVPGSVSQRVQAILSRPVILIDRDDKIVDLLVCADSSRMLSRSVSLATGKRRNHRIERIGSDT